MRCNRQAEPQSQELLHCESCGHEVNADTNATRNILTSGTRIAPSKRAKARQKRESRHAA
ncbi:zinc ribbon domain-containing protein [Roseibium sp. RKSG952]|uniref:zinc ribbon domain-containing protein n=1 Tax=Roseibium sp. RKSG952 TaxID=2529384 RepID=UPI0012BB50FE|nr:hypothetical protein [Roseibium sp. RKSG952]